MCLGQWCFDRSFLCALVRVRLCVCACACSLVRVRVRVFAGVTQLVSAVTSAMKLHPKVEDVQCHCVGLLVALSAHRPLLRHMARLGCAGAIGVAAHCYPEDAEVMCVWCVPLRRKLS